MTFTTLSNIYHDKTIPGESLLLPFKNCVKLLGRSVQALSEEEKTSKLTSILKRIARFVIALIGSITPALIVPIGLAVKFNSRAKFAIAQEKKELVPETETLKEESEQPKEKDSHEDQKIPNRSWSLNPDDPHAKFPEAVALAKAKGVDLTGKTGINSDDLEPDDSLDAKPKVAIPKGPKEPVFEPETLTKIFGRSPDVVPEMPRWGHYLKPGWPDQKFPAYVIAFAEAKGIDLTGKTSLTADDLEPGDLDNPTSWYHKNKHKVIKNPEQD